MRATIVIPTYNAAPFLRACFDSVFAQPSVEFNIIAVDNGSADDTVDLIRQSYPSVQVITNKTNLGFASATNQGIRAALTAPDPADVIVLLNQDTAVDPGWLAALIAPLQADESVGIVGSLARFPDGRLQHAGGQLLWPRGYGRNLAAGAQELPDDPPAPDYIAGLATALRATMLQEIGLFDEAFNPAYFEDADLCLRAQAAGWALRLAPDATLIHYEGARGRSDYSHSAILERNRLRFVLKHQEPDALLGAFARAEHEQIQLLPPGSSRQVLSQAYLHALIALPRIASARALSTTMQAALTEMLTELRTAAAAVPTSQSSASVSGREIRTPRHTEFRTGESPPVSIIMLTWNGLAITQACVESLRQQTQGVDYQLFVVDNGSTDGTREWLRTQSDIRLIENSTNVGFVAGNNQAMREIPAEHDVVLLNNDMLIIQPDWLARLRDAANGDVDTGVVGCVLLRPDGMLQHAGTYMPASTYWGYQIGGGERYVGQYPDVREVQGVVGACMYIRRDVRATIGLLDEDFFSYFEDTDYCLRAIQAGYKVLCLGDVKLIHYENTSTKINNANWSKMFSVSQATFLRKWREPLEQRYTRSVVWQSLVAAKTGYGTSSREFVLELDRRAVDVRLVHVFGTDYTEISTGDPRIEQLRLRPKDRNLPQVVYSQGDAFIKNSGRYRVGYTMLEADGLPRDWVAQANQMDEVWTPTTWGAEVFAESGVRRPIHVVPLGVNPDYFHPGIDRRHPGDRFAFLSIFEWIERKAPEVLLRAYVEEFGPADQVVLILKTFRSGGGKRIQQRIADLSLGATSAPIVVLEDQAVPAYQMGCIYRSADCFVLPTRGEGWGMPILEAMACGLPVIATDWGAQRDFFHEGVGYPLRSRGLRPAVTESPYYAGLRWADPDVEHLRHLMRYVYEHAAEAREVGTRAAHEVAARWTWAHATDRILARLDESQA